MPDTVETRLARVEERLIALSGDVQYLARQIDKLCTQRDENRQDIVRLQERQSQMTRLLVGLQLLGSTIATWLGMKQ